MKLFRVSVFILLVGLLIIGASATAWSTPTQSWVTDPATGCKIGWVHDESTLISASWSGPMVAGKAQGKGNLSLTLKVNDGKEKKGQGEVEMLAGLLHGKATIKWSDGNSYDGYYKAGLKEGKGIYKWADGSSYAGEWKNSNMEGRGTYKWPNGDVYEGEIKAGNREGKGIMKWADGEMYDGQWKADKREGKGIYKAADGDMYDGEWKADKREGKGIYKYADGRIYDGEWKNGKIEGHGVGKDAAGKIIYEGEWKDNKPVTQSAQPKTDKVLDIPWGASVDEAKRIMQQRPKTSSFGASTNAKVKLHTWHTYIGYFNDDVARLQVHFYEGKMFGVDACVYTSEDQLLDKFNSIKQGLTQRYGPPAITAGKYLDTHVWWDLGGGYGVTMSIKKSTMFKDTPFEIIISYRNRATQNAINKAGGPTSGNDY